MPPLIQSCLQSLPTPHHSTDTVLSDAEQRKVYDMGGEEALKQGGGGGGGASFHSTLGIIPRLRIS